MRHCVNCPREFDDSNASGGMVIYTHDGEIGICMECMMDIAAGWYASGMPGIYREGE